MRVVEPQKGIRQSELLACLSLAIDLGLGLPAEWMLRTAMVSVRLARAAGLPDELARTAYFAALVRFVGCTSTSAGDARLFGDELAMTGFFSADPDDARAMLGTLVRLVGATQPLPRRALTLARFFRAMSDGTLLNNHFNHCEGAAILAERLALGPDVALSVWSLYERWNGKGTPRGLAGEAIDLAARVVHVATVATQAEADGGLASVDGVLAARAGRQLDPALVASFRQDSAALLAPVEGPLFDAVIAAEPGPALRLTGEALDTALAAIADFVDHKIPQTLGHSRRVADLAASAGRLCGLPAADLALLTTAACLHDTGRLGVSAGLLGKAGRLTPSEWERIRLHPYLTERVYAPSPALAAAGRLGATHHERLDGSGYHRGLAAAELSAPARLLAAANTWAGLTEDRPHRPRADAASAKAQLAAAAGDGRLDRRAVDAVLAAAGERAPRRSAAVALSEREVEVLRLLARQASNKDIARRLGIAPKTVEHHVRHIFDKTGATTRTGAALYATHNNLL